MYTSFVGILAFQWERQTNARWLAGLIEEEEPKPFSSD